MELTLCLLFLVLCGYLNSDECNSHEKNFTISLQEKEFLKMFQMPVIEVPTNLPNIRQDLPIQAFAVGHLILGVHVCLIYQIF